MSMGVEFLTEAAAVGEKDDCHAATFDHAVFPTSGSVSDSHSLFYNFRLYSIPLIIELVIY